MGLGLGVPALRAFPPSRIGIHCVIDGPHAKTKHSV